MINSEKVIFTIGHSNLTMKDFIAFLRENEIEVVADVRSTPYSRYVPHFNKESFETALKVNGFKYVFMGKELGGKPADQCFYDNKGRVSYGLLANSLVFQQGLNRLIKGVNSGLKIVVVCAEKDPLTCHRHLLIARELEGHQVKVIHFRENEPVLYAQKYLVPQSRQLQLFE